MVRLGRIEALERNYLGDDRLWEGLRVIELSDVVVGDLFLRRIRKENRRTILRPLIGPLPVELRRIVRCVEEHLEQIAVRDLRRIVSDLHRFRVPGRPGTHDLVLRG